MKKRSGSSALQRAAAALHERTNGLASEPAFTGADDARAHNSSEADGVTERSGRSASDEPNAHDCSDHSHSHSHSHGHFHNHSSSNSGSGSSDGEPSDSAANDHNSCFHRLAEKAAEAKAVVIKNHDWYRGQTVDPSRKYDDDWFSLIRKIFIGRFVFVLHAIHMIPETYQFNPFIRTGYRVSLRKRDCVRSVYRGLHNETGNIYTHLVGSLGFVYLLFSTWSWLNNVSIVHYCVFAVYLLSALQCLLCSTVYHVFGCHCVCTFEKLLSLDYSGISFLIVGSQLPILIYLFWDDPTLMFYHVTILLAISLATHILTHAQRFQAESYMMLRVVAFCSNALYATPVLMYTMWHRLVALATPELMLNGSVWAIVRNPAANDRATLELFECLYYVGWMYLFYGTGIFFYSSKLPERLSPGRFDYWAHSHQIWHIFVVAAATAQFYACVHIFLYRESEIPLIDPALGSPFLNSF